MRGIGIVLVIGLASTIPDATAFESAATAQASACLPAKPLSPPRYPSELAKRGVGGTVLLELALDACGRVERAHVKQSSGKPALDEAALESVKDVTLTTEQRAKAADGTLQLPISFSMDPKSYEYQVVDWPRSHKRARYELESASGEFANAAAAAAAFPFNPAMAWPSPYPSSRFVQTGIAGQREFWLFVLKERVPSVAVHYRPVLVDDEAVVKMSILCDADAAACAQATTALLKGLPFAKAR